MKTVLSRRNGKNPWKVIANVVVRYAMMRASAIATETTTATGNDGEEKNVENQMMVVMRFINLLNTLTSALERVNRVLSAIMTIAIVSQLGVKFPQRYSSNSNSSVDR